MAGYGAGLRGDGGDCRADRGDDKSAPPRGGVSPRPEPDRRKRKTAPARRKVKIRMKSLPAAPRRHGLLACQIALAIAVALLLAPAGMAGSLISGGWGLAAAVVAAVCCWLGAASALAAAVLLADVAGGLAGLLAGMVLRMGIPLTCGLVLHLRNGALAQAGVLYYLLVFYPVTLAVEIALSLPRTSAAKPAANLPKQRPS